MLCTVHVFLWIDVRMKTTRHTTRNDNANTYNKKATMQQTFTELRVSKCSYLLLHTLFSYNGFKFVSLESKTLWLKLESSILELGN